MDGETEEIKIMVDHIRKLAKNERTVECQSQCMTGFIYYQGIIDSLTDVLDNIYKIQAEKKLNGGVEVE